MAPSPRFVAVLAVGAGVASAGLTLAGGHAELRAVGHPRNVAVALLIGWSFVGAGLVAWRRRPDSRFGPLLCAVGFAWFGSALITANSPVLFSIGLLVAPWWLAVFLHSLLAFPTGVLADRWRRAVVAMFYLDVTVVQAAWVFLSPSPGLAGCEGCPDNVLLVADHPHLAEGLLVVEQPVLGSLAIAGALILLGRQWRRASGPQRRALAPTVVSGSLCLLVLAVTLFAEPFSYEVGQAVGWVGAFAFAAVPVVFLAGLLRQRLDQSSVGHLVAELSSLPGARPLDEVLRRSLKDPSLRVAYWSADDDRYVDEYGGPFALPAPDWDVAVTLVERDGKRIAALVHDASLAEDPALVAGIGAAIGLALENDGLHAEVRAQVEELRASRLRLVEAGDRERRRLERNLHDGAQQRLLALGLLLGRAERSAGDDSKVRGLVGMARTELARCLVELRELALGIHPAVLTDHGLAVAVQGAAARAPLPVQLTVDLPRRLPLPVEVAAYYLICEALANTVKHAHAHRVRVDVREELDGVHVEVGDDGVGGATASGGSGLHGLSDRIAALDGTLLMTSPRGEGTCVQAVIPCG